MTTPLFRRDRHVIESASRLERAQEAFAETALAWVGQYVARATGVRLRVIGSDLDGGRWRAVEVEMFPDAARVARADLEPAVEAALAEAEAEVNLLSSDRVGLVQRAIDRRASTAARVAP